MKRDVHATGPGLAVVTGATAGIGAAFAHRLAADGYHLVLVARDEQRLHQVAGELARRYEISAEVLPADLGTTAGCEHVAERLRDHDSPVDLLVNNAGMSLNRSFLATTEEAEEALLALNVTAVLRLTKAVLPGMVERGRGGILNVSSVSGFAPVMPGSTYPASKSWVTNFTQSIAGAVRRLGVTVMVLCPGYTRTEFHRRAGVNLSGTPRWMWLDADRVVADALRDLSRGKLVSIPSWRYRAAVFAMRHLPARVLRLGPRDRRGADPPAATADRIPPK
jgi:short-subunit dehydrogenase